MRDYWAMSNEELEREASRYKIGEYGDARGTISRDRIISQLVAKDTAQEVPKVSLRSWIAVAISIGSFLLSIYSIMVR